MKKIDIAVGGRFHSDYMVRALRPKADVLLYTTFPRGRFPFIEDGIIRSSIRPELVYRIAKKLRMEDLGDRFKMERFGTTVAYRVSQRRPDVFAGWSSFALETLREGEFGRSILIRDSTHIADQYDILEAEYERHRARLPSRSFCEERELEEYDLADEIVVCSELSRKSFLTRGFAPAKVKVLTLGVDTSRFLPQLPTSIRLPVRVVYFGTLSLRKGIYYLLEATSGFDPRTLEIHLVGNIDPGFRRILTRYSHARYQVAVPQARLAEIIRTMDIAVLPSLEDGFGQLVPQAIASGLACIVTDQCGAADLVMVGRDGFIIPARDVDALKRSLETLVGDLNLLLRFRQHAANRSMSLGRDTYQRTVRDIFLGIAE